MVHFQGWLALSRNYYQPNLYAGKEAIVRTGHGTMDWLQIGKGVHLGCILSRCLFNVKCWVEKLELELPGEISITSDMPISPP